MSFGWILRIARLRLEVGYGAGGAGGVRAADKIVRSRTLQAPSSARTRIEREFDPAAIR
jgi:hypothetical protein